MYAYSMTMEYSITALILFSTILSLIDFKEGVPTNVANAIDVGIECLIQGGYSVYMFIIYHVLKDKRCTK